MQISKLLKTPYHIRNLFRFGLNENTRHLLRICLILAISVASFLIIGYRIDQAPDIHLDEILYYQVAFNLASQGEFSWDMRPVLVHPPIYFISQALFLHLTGLAEKFLPFTGTYTVRLVNAFAGAITVGFLFRLIERLGGLRAAILASAIFVLDPFVVRINRRNMLETMAEMWVVIGLYLFWRERDRLTTRKTLLIGTIFGIALLTKELMIFGMAVIPLFVVLAGRWRDIKKVILMSGVALSLWSLFPFWAWSVGQLDKFVHNKTFNFRRLIGEIQVTGWNRADVSFVEALKVHFAQYGTSYTLILIGALLTLLLFFTWRDERGRFILAWSGMMYAFSAYIIFVGTLNEFFFYYLMLPVVATIGAMVVRFWDLRRGRQKEAVEQNGILILTNVEQLPKFMSLLIKGIDRRLMAIADFVKGAGQWTRHHRRLANGLLLLIMLSGLTIQSYNLYRWTKLFAIEEDKVMYDLVRYVEQNLPPDTPVNSMFGGGDLMLPLMLPQHEFVTLRDANDIQTRNVAYAMLSSKNLWGAYGNITPEYYDWVETHGELLFSTYGNTFWDVGLYQIPMGQEDMWKALEELDLSEEELLEFLDNEDY